MINYQLISLRYYLAAIKQFQSQTSCTDYEDTCSSVLKESNREICNNNNILIIK